MKRHTSKTSYKKNIIAKNFKKRYLKKHYATKTIKSSDDDKEETLRKIVPDDALIELYKWYRDDFKGSLNDIIIGVDEGYVFPTEDFEDFDGETEFYNSSQRHIDEVLEGEYYQADVADCDPATKEDFIEFLRDGSWFLSLISENDEKYQELVEKYDK